MITPRFTCAQDETTVTIKCYMPAIRASEVDIHVDSKTFTLHVNPYFLRLNFSHELIEDDESNALYDPSSAYLTIVLSKEVPGVEFKDLDLISTLLNPSEPVPISHGAVNVPEPSPRNFLEVPSASTVERGIAGMSLSSESSIMETSSKKPPSRMLIEVLGDEPNLVVTEDPKLPQKLREERQVFLKAKENDWRLPQTVPGDAELSGISISGHKTYGFLDSYSGFFAHGRQNANDVNLLGDLAETASDVERLSMRTYREDQKWDEEYYMADFVNDEEIQEYIAWNPPYLELLTEFTEQELAIMLRLPRKEYIPTSLQEDSLYVTLLTLLFSYAYDCRTTLHDPTAESAWTLAVLTPCMSALDTTPLLPAIAFRASYRRALAFPLYRNWGLCERVRLDVAELLAGGRRKVCRALLEMKEILDNHDSYYVYSKIWVDDYCVWIQSGASDQSLLGLADVVRNLKIDKADIGWSLEELEEATREVEGESSDYDAR